MIIKANELGGMKMFKKLFIFSIILFMSILLMNISYASDVLMDLNDTNSNNEQTTDNTIYSATSDSDQTTATEPIQTESVTDYEQVSSTTTDYDNSGELSVSNMINIILIVVGVVLVLLGIAIIIKLK